MVIEDTRVSPRRQSIALIFVSIFCFFLFGSVVICCFFFFFFSSRRRHTRSTREWSSDVCSSDLSFDCGRGNAREYCCRACPRPPRQQYSRALPRPQSKLPRQRQARAHSRPCRQHLSNQEPDGPLLLARCPVGPRERTSSQSRSRECARAPSRIPRKRSFPFPRV